MPEHLDGAVCSTGFVVLRPDGTDPYSLAALLQTDFFTLQLLRNNVGIAYPTFEPQCLPLLRLPVSEPEMASLSKSAREYVSAQQELIRAKREFSRTLETLTATTGGPTPTKDH